MPSKNYEPKKKKEVDVKMTIVMKDDFPIILDYRWQKRLM